MLTFHSGADVLTASKASKSTIKALGSPSFSHTAMHKLNPKICYLDGFDDGVRHAWCSVMEWVVPLAVTALMIAHIEYKRAYE